MMVLMTVSATFIFALRELDERFHELNDEIAERARAIPGFMGEEAWHDDKTGLHSEVYYWETADALRELIAMDTHGIAKGLADNWIAEYRVVIAEVQSVYGHASLGLTHIPPGAPALGA
jgi:heme-degrading monooxygenase HmoA